MTLLADNFGKSRLRKLWLDKCLKSRVSEDPETQNKAYMPKHYCDMSGSTFTKFINHSEGSCIGKLLF